MRAALLLAVCPVLAACASDGPERQELPDRPSYGSSAAPDGLVEMRETLAAQRSDTRDAMDATLIQGNTLGSTTNDGSLLDQTFGLLDQTFGLVDELWSWVPPAAEWLYWW